MAMASSRPRPTVAHVSFSNELRRSTNVRTCSSALPSRPSAHAEGRANGLSQLRGHPAPPAIAAPLGAGWPSVHGGALAARTASASTRRAGMAQCSWLANPDFVDLTPHNGDRQGAEGGGAARRHAGRGSSARLPRNVGPTDAARRGGWGRAGTSPDGDSLPDPPAWVRGGSAGAHGVVANEQRGARDQGDCRSAISGRRTARAWTSVSSGVPRPRSRGCPPLLWRCPRM